MKRTFLAILTICASLIAVGETIDFHSGLKIELGDWTYEDGIFKSPTLPYGESSDLVCYIPGFGTLGARYTIYNSTGPAYSVGYTGIKGVYEFRANTGSYSANRLFPAVELNGGTYIYRFTNYNQEEPCRMEFSEITWTPAPDFITVTFNPLLGTCKEETRQYVPGKPYGDFPIPERKGFKFLGWSTTRSYMNVNGEYYDITNHLKETSIVPAASLTLYACWNVNATQAIDPYNTLDSIFFDIDDLGYHIDSSSMWLSQYDYYNGYTNSETIVIQGQYIPPNTKKRIMDATFHGSGRLTFLFNLISTSGPYIVLLDGKEIEYVGLNTIRVDEDCEHHLTIDLNNDADRKVWGNCTIRALRWRPETTPWFITEDYCSDEYHEWLDQNGYIYPPYGDDPAYLEYISMDGDDAHGWPLWMSFVAGVKPTTKLSQLTASIEMENGKPKISINPDLGEKRIYIVYGSNDLKSWNKVDDTNLEDFRFFKVEVKMPAQN